MKSGKSTLASQYPNPIFFATERGYNALAGVMAQDITTWSEMKQAIKQLKKDEVKQRFSTVVVDTVDRAAVMCEKYVCAQAGVDALSEVPYGGGWSLLKKEFESEFQKIAQEGYAIVFIAHSKEGTFKRPDGSEYTQILPSVATSYNSILENMADIYIYLHPILVDGTSKVILTLRSLDGSVRCGGRFKYIVPEIDASYDALVKAINNAIDKEAEIHGNEYITDKKDTIKPEKQLDFDELLKEFNNMIKLVNEKENFESYWQPRIVNIIETYLGKGKKINQCTRDQVEMIELINLELKSLLAENKIALS